MKSKPLDINDDKVDDMIRIKWGKWVANPNEPSFVSYDILGKIYGIDGSSVRRLVMN